MDIDADSARVKFPPPLAFLGTLLLGMALDKVTWFPGIPLGDYLENSLGWVAIAAGFAVMFTAVGLFRKAGTDPKPWKASSALVTDGVYRWTRNPMYLGMALVYAGIAFVADSMVALVLLVPLIFVIQREVIEREEAYLAGRFGNEYLAYKARVGRWFGAQGG